ncbi:MAG: bifunctional phosphoribosylaminoimidazolecarboxamide formyltransferase/IMP cyclohydrolase [Thermoanaerobaculia bacterium]
MNIERAILSVSDKTGIVELARALEQKGIEILSTGGTAKHLADAGIKVTPISQWSGAPEILGGRVKTLTPKVFGAILHNRDDASHVADVQRLSIPPIDLVVVNLYPFEETITRKGVTLAEAVEQIDIGGPSMLRAAAKNHRHVVVLSDPAMYDDFLEELATGDISDDFRLHAAIAVFAKTADYDIRIANYLNDAAHAAGEHEHGGDDEEVETMTLDLDKFQDLRYGENPHQTAGFWVYPDDKPFEQIHGKELSYNNLLDLDAAIKLANAFTEPAAAVIKHTNPCGVARRTTIAEALKAAIEADPVSAFGGIIGVNGELDAASASAIADLFLEVVVARSFSPEALEILTKKKNLRLVTTDGEPLEHEVRSAAGGFLVQATDRLSSRESWRVVTDRQPSEAELKGLEFAWIVCAHVKSNAIVLTTESQTVGVGAGQMSRVDAAKVAIMKSILPTAGTFAASDAFFPFRDGLDLLADAGVRAVIQPGGSVRDAEVIAAANERGITMVFTGERHFRH